MQVQKIFLILFSVLLTNLFASKPLTLNKALEILQTQNIEIKIASLDVDSAKAKIDVANGNNWGKLDLIQDVVNSDDAGNVFGFKLTSREASFNDFGFSEFGNIAMDEPIQGLNYPDSQTFFQTKLKYELPIFTGYKITSYSSILKSMKKMKLLDKDKIINEKIYELKKSYHDMSLLNTSINHLNIILSNIIVLENTTQNMIDVGYAKKVDLLEVKAKKGNVERLISQMKHNQKLLYHYISFLLNQKVVSVEILQASVLMPNINDEDILQNNLDIQKASTGLEIRDSMTDVAKSAYYPMVGVFAEIATADNSFLSNISDHKAYTVGARLQWNLFNGGVDYYKIQEAKVEQLKVESQIQLAQHAIILKIKKLRTEIQTQDSEIASLNKELDLANEIYKNYEGRYKEKLSSMSDVIIKQSEQIQKILQLQEAKNKRNERIFALVKLANGDK
ncbi:MAG: TolC family protein [Sulfurimonas sp.]|nr:TolC family protein [Sulfurimonas sp.]